MAPGLHSKLSVMYLINLHFFIYCYCFQRYFCNRNYVSLQTQVRFVEETVNFQQHVKGRLDEFCTNHSAIIMRLLNTQKILLNEIT